MFDETLSFVAADRIADQWRASVGASGVHTVQHRVGLFQLLGMDEGLTSASYFFSPSKIYHDHCTCPPWMVCYCGQERREMDELELNGLYNHALIASLMVSRRYF